MPVAVTFIYSIRCEEALREKGRLLRDIMQQTEQLRLTTKMIYAHTLYYCGYFVYDNALKSYYSYCFRLRLVKKQTAKKKEGRFLIKLPCYVDGFDNRFDRRPVSESARHASGELGTMSR